MNLEIEAHLLPAPVTRVQGGTFYIQFQSFYLILRLFNQLTILIELISIEYVC